jgi:hypothetical protein
MRDAGTWGLLVYVCLTAGGAQAQAPSAPAFVPRLSDAAEAMEYWDVTAQFESGHRFLARFLITNEGPGAHTAAAVAHLILPEGTVVPIKYGRTRDAWVLSPDRLRLKIASAVLDLGDPLWRVEVDSDTHGFKVLLQLTRAVVPVSSAPLPGSYWIDVVMPTPAHGTVWVRGMEAPQPVEGSIALTYTRMDHNEAELVRRRAELFARTGDAGIYLADLTFADGRRYGALIVRDGEGVLHRSDDLSPTFAGVLKPAADPQYPVPERWDATGPTARAEVRIRHEWLRWAPLDIVPQPFRFLLALRAAPQLVWADADFELSVTAGADRTPLETRGRGVALIAFARPLPAP